MMPIKSGIRVVSITFLILAIFTPQIWVGADIGPKPSFTFLFDFNALDEEPGIDEVLLYRCLDAECAEKEEVSVIPGQQMRCNEEGCSTDILTSGEAWQIEVNLQDRTLTSEPFLKEGFWSKYQLIFLDDQVLVQFLSATEPAVSDPDADGVGRGKTLQSKLVVAAFLTIILELPLGALLLFAYKSRFLDLVWILLGNIISIPVVWLLMPGLGISSNLFVILSLVISILIEWIVLGWLSGERFSWLRAGLIAALINIASTAVGVLAGI